MNELLLESEFRVHPTKIEEDINFLENKLNEALEKEDYLYCAKLLKEINNIKSVEP